MNVYFQPIINVDGNITGHEDSQIFSFEVWHNKENLLLEFPNCKPVKYSGDDIEEPTYRD
jgi:hypothetical protein